MSEGLITAIASSHGPRYRALNAKQVPVIRAFDYIIPVLPDVHKHADNTQADLASSGRGGKKRQAGTREAGDFVFAECHTWSQERPLTALKLRKHRLCGYV